MKQVRQVVAVLAMLGGFCHACSLAIGHFHQVTSIKGKVVGSSWIPVRWIRQSISVKDARLMLYEYRASARLEERKKIAEITSGNDGSFDFGSIPPGHYSLVVEMKNSDRMGGWFDVEITESVRATKSVTLDVSPIHPDCSGGNEFIETKIQSAERSH